ncbi:flippase-like domain-containing protein [Armatimonas sp.]|uniref:flippase-like domain-containing protein n=1 Tax=Armatimonas sp. TaxID=1872638 RepID=UPI00286D3F63|nr:flippase-like domain-containing protein [Armatimonas sp.]
MQRPIVTLLLALAGVLAIYFQRQELRAVTLALEQAQLLPVLGASVCQLGFFALMIGLHSAAFQAVGAPSRWSQLAPVWFTSLFVNLTVPGTGATAFVTDANRRGISPARATAALLLVRVCDLATFGLVLLGGLTLLWLHDALRITELLASLGLLVLIALWGGGLVLAQRAPRLLERLLTGMEKRAFGRLPMGWGVEQARHATESAGELFSQPRRLVLPLCLALFAHVMDVLCLAFLGRACGLHLTPGTVLAAFSVGLLFWIVTITPDGLGAVEGMMSLTFVSLGVPIVKATAVTLAFRGLALWLPLAVGGLLHFSRLRRNIRGDMAVRMISTLTALMGLTNLLSATLPALGLRLAFLRNHLPLEVRYGSRLATVLAAFALLLLAQGLLRRKQLAHRLTMAALVLSVVAHLSKGLDWEEATLALGLLLALWSQRTKFIARSDGPSIHQGFRVLLGALGFTLVYGVFGFWLLDRHFAYNFGFRAALEQTLAMFFSFSDSGPLPMTRFGHWFTDSIYTVAATTLGYALFTLLQPVLLRQHATVAEQEKARLIVEAHGRSSLARFVLLSDKLYWFSPGGSVVGYALVGRSAVALGDPIGQQEDCAVAIEGFVAFCTENDWEPAFYQTLPDHLDAYETAGLQALGIGSEAVVELESFTLAGRAGKSLRGGVGRLRKSGYTAEVLSPPYTPEFLHQLKAVSDDWLHQQHGGEKRFSLGWFDEIYLSAGPVTVVYDPGGTVVAFANIIPEYQKSESTIDLMRRRRSAESGVMDLLFVTLFEWAKEQGFATFNLGLSPLSGVGQDATDPLVERVLNLVFRRGGRFYSFEGLHAYKRKFQPRWEPRYLIYRSSLALPQAAAAVVRADNPNRSRWNRWNYRKRSEVT